MRSARPDAFWRPAARLIALGLLGWGALRLASGRGGVEDADGPPPSRGPGRRAVLLATAALLLLAGAGWGGWAALQRQERQAIARALTGGEPARAPALMIRYGCGGCHAIPGVPGAEGRVAAPLSGLRERVFIGGVARNSAENLMAWIVDPRALSPRSAMPRTGITPEEARDVAAYLYAR